MGANCCIAAKEKQQPSLASIEVSAYRIRHSPSWSFRWDNRTHIEDIMETNTVFSNHSSGNIQPDLKSGSLAPAEGGNSGNGQADAFCKFKGQKYEKKMEASKLSKVDPQEDQSAAKNSPPEANSLEPLDVPTVASEIKEPMSLPSKPTIGSIAEPADPSFSINHSNSMLKASGHQPYRQIMDANAPALKTSIEHSSEERRPSSSTLSSDYNDLFAALSHGEPSDGLSIRTPSESVVTSQRDGWLVDNEPVCSTSCKLSGSNASDPTFSPDQGVCKLCSRLLRERSSWNGHELAVVAVLFCGHAYHANCLDSITAESEKYDPPCPVCTHGESCATKIFGKLDSKIKSNISENMSASDLSQRSKHQKKSMRGPRLGISSSMKGSFRQPFLRRHFSTGSRPPRSVLGSEQTWKKSFWSRRRRE